MPSNDRVARLDIDGRLFGKRKRGCPRRAVAGWHMRAFTIEWVGYCRHPSQHHEGR